MSVKLTKAQGMMLVDLSERSSPWRPESKGDASVCKRLERMALASYSYGYPVGYSITGQGRSALAQERTDGR